MSGDGYHVWVCLECGRQHRGPGGHKMAGDDLCSCNGDGHSSPHLAKIDVSIVDAGVRGRLYRARRNEEKRQAKRRLDDGARAVAVA